MWNLISTNQLTHQGTKNKNYQIHQQKLRKIKGTMSIRSPSQPIFLYTKPKLQMARRDRLLQIDRQNAILLTKMDCIYDKPNDPNQPQWMKNISKNVTNMTRSRIDIENKQICNRLMKSNSHYPTTRILTQTSRLNRIGQNISENARRSKSITRLSLSRPVSARNSISSKFIRSATHKENNQDQIKVDIEVNEKDIKNKGWQRPASAPAVRIIRQPKQILGQVVCQMSGSGQQEMI